LCWEGLRRKNRKQPQQEAEPRREADRLRVTVSAMKSHPSLKRETRVDLSSLTARESTGGKNVCTKDEKEDEIESLLPASVDTSALSGDVKLEIRRTEVEAAKQPDVRLTASECPDDTTLEEKEKKGSDRVNVKGTERPLTKRSKPDKTSCCGNGRYLYVRKV